MSGLCCFQQCVCVYIEIRRKSAVLCPSLFSSNPIFIPSNCPAISERDLSVEFPEVEDILPMKSSSLSALKRNSADQALMLTDGDRCIKSNLSLFPYLSSIISPSDIEYVPFRSCLRNVVENVLSWLNVYENAPSFNPIFCRYPSSFSSISLDARTEAASARALSLVNLMAVPT